MTGESSTPSGSTGGSSNETGTSSSQASSASGAACNALDPTGAAITGTCSTATAPTASGGTIADGTYNLVGFVDYVSTEADCQEIPSVQITLTVTGGTVVDIVTSAEGETNRANAALTTLLDNFSLTTVCGTSTLSNGTYSATATTITIYNQETDPTGVLELDFSM